MKLASPRTPSVEPPGGPAAAARAAIVEALAELLLDDLDREESNVDNVDQEDHVPPGETTP